MLHDPSVYQRFVSGLLDELFNVDRLRPLCQNIRFGHQVPYPQSYTAEREEADCVSAMYLLRFSERLIFAPRVDLGAYLARLRRADLFLDTWPYNAGTTANDALFVGLPLLTCAGETLASRVAGSQLHAMDAPELVTDDLAAYERKAIELARAPDELARLRAKLDARRATSILFDMERYTRRFEDALEDAWRDYERGSASAAS